MDIYNSDDYKIIKAIKKANNELLRQDNILLKDYNLTASQFGVLESLYLKGNMCINKLIERLVSSSGTMTVIIKKLQEKGLIIKENSCEDKRYFNVCLTDEGRNLIMSILPDREKEIKDFANTLTAEEKEKFLNIMYKFKERYKVKKSE